MIGLSIKQNVDSAPTVFAGYFDVCLTGCHGDGSALLPYGQVVPIVASEDVSTDAANKLVIFVISHFSAPCFFLGFIQFPMSLRTDSMKFALSS